MEAQPNIENFQIVGVDSLAADFKYYEDYSQF
jgi:hypothetical protein